MVSFFLTCHFHHVVFLLLSVNIKVIKSFKWYTVSLNKIALMFSLSSRMKQENPIIVFVVISSYFIFSVHVDSPWLVSAVDCWRAWGGSWNSKGFQPVGIWFNCSSQSQISPSIGTWKLCSLINHFIWYIHLHWRARYIKPFSLQFSADNHEFGVLPYLFLMLMRRVIWNMMIIVQIQRESYGPKA